MVRTGSWLRGPARNRRPRVHVPEFDRDSAPKQRRAPGVCALRNGFRIMPLGAASEPRRASLASGAVVGDGKGGLMARKKIGRGLTAGGDRRILTDIHATPIADEVLDLRSQV